jgi:hypothetical protein
MKMHDSLIDIFKIVGMEVPVRNFLIDFSDSKGISYFNPIQTVCLVDYKDSDIISNITAEMKKEAMTVNAITEVYGKHTLDELFAIAENAELMLITGFKYLYLKR